MSEPPNAEASPVDSGPGGSAGLGINGVDIVLGVLGAPLLIWVLMFVTSGMTDTLQDPPRRRRFLAAIVVVELLLIGGIVLLLVR